MSNLRMVMKWLLAMLFVVAGLNHFLRPGFYVSIMPPYLPWHLPAVYLSGAAEMVLGILLLVPRVQTVAAWSLVALLIAVFPANVHMAMNPELFPAYHPAALWARLPVQGVLIAWAYWFTGDGVPRPRKSGHNDPGFDSIKRG
jgi:uncharacterized membrane protein